MGKGYKIFPRSDLYRKNWDETFFDANKTDDENINDRKSHVQTPEEGFFLPSCFLVEKGE